MIRTLALVAACLLAMPAAAQDKDKLARLEGIWRKTVKQYGIPQSALVLGYRGKIVFADGIGRTADTPADVASLSKAFTAMCISRLVSSGKLKTATTLGQVFGPNLEGLGLNAPQNASITVAQLLTHASGIRPDRTQNGGMRAYYGQSRSRDVEVAQKALSARTQGAGKFFYNNENYAVLGAVIEKVARSAPYSYCKSAVFSRIGARSVRPSGYWGAYGSAAGWQISTRDLHDFAWSYLGPRSSVGGKPNNWPRAAKNNSEYYGMGSIFAFGNRGVAYQGHLGNLRNGQGRSDAGFFIAMGNGWTIAYTGNKIQGKPLTTFQGAMLKAARGKG